MVQMLGNSPMGSRRRYLAQQEIEMEALFSKADGFTTPITKPVASFKAPSVSAAPKIAKPKGTLKPTATLPSATQRLTSLKQNLIGQTQPGSPAPAAAANVGAVGKGDRLRRKGKFQRTSASTVAKREPLKTSINEDDARKVIDRYGLKGPLPKGLDREQKMAAYEARYVSAGGKKAAKWQRRTEVADKVKTGGLGIATAGGAVWLGSRGKHYKSLKAIKATPKKEHAETIAGAGAVAGGAGELYAGHARRKRSSYASAPAGVAASALRRMRDYT